MRNRCARNKNFPVESYKEYEWDGKTFLMTYVTDFYDHWMDAYARRGATHHAGITILIHTLPSPWREWVAEAAESFTWYSPPEYEPRGDMIGLLGYYFRPWRLHPTDPHVVHLRIKFNRVKPAGGSIATTRNHMSLALPREQGSGCALRPL